MNSLLARTVLVLVGSVDDFSTIVSDSLHQSLVEPMTIPRELFIFELSDEDRSLALKDVSFIKLLLVVLVPFMKGTYFKYNEP